MYEKPVARELVLARMDDINSEKSLIITEARKLLSPDITAEQLRYLDELYVKYKELEMDEEFCTFCLMFDIAKRKDIY